MPTDTFDPPSTPGLAEKICSSLRCSGPIPPWVLLDILQSRFSVDWGQLHRAIAFAEGNGWVCRKDLNLTLTDEGRSMLRVGATPIPPAAAPLPTREMA